MIVEPVQTSSVRHSRVRNPSPRPITRYGTGENGLILVWAGHGVDENMNSEQLVAAARTVAQLGDYLEDLKRQALAIVDPAAVTVRGYITPSTELAVRHLQLSYWKTRNALFELVISHD